MGLRGSEKSSLDERIAQLSEGQRECLYLVSQMHNSKEIARLVGKSPHTVDERLKRAVALLEAGSRFEAARLYLEHLNNQENAPASQPAHQSLIYQGTGVQEGFDPLETLITPNPHAGLGSGGSNELRQVQAAYAASPRTESNRSFSWASVLDGTHRNRLSPNLRLAAIALIAVLAIFGFGVLVSIAEGLSRLT